MVLDTFAVAWRTLWVCDRLWIDPDPRAQLPAAGAAGTNGSFHLARGRMVWQKIVQGENSRTLVLLGAARTPRQRRASVLDVRGKSWSFVLTADIESSVLAWAHAQDAEPLLQ